jgi:GDP-4-dehydro-6-deoxy-D-mannose reductase
VNVFVTGASGFIGSHLVDLLLARGDAVTAYGRHPPMQSVTFAAGDILDAASLADAIARTAPDSIFHLAAQSLPGHSWSDPAGTFRANVDGTINLLEAVRNHAPRASVVFTSSSSVYAQPADGGPLREEDAMGPSSLYGVSKMAADQAARLFATRWNIRVVIARPFFWIGPRKTGDVTSDWCRRIVALERGTAREMAVGNLDIVRDFIDVRDGVEALALLAECGESAHAYNIGSGAGTPLRNVLLSLCELSRVPAVWRVDPALVRAVDEPVRVADVAKIRALGWLPRRDLKMVLRETLDFWRNTG